MNSIEANFFEAAAVLHRRPLAKLLRPGALRLGMRALARRRGQSIRREAQLFFGQPMSVVLPEVISEALYTYGLFDETVTWMVLQSVRPGDIVLDVGAHFGYFSLLCAHLAQPGGHVYAFEPTPSTYSVLAENARRAGNITAVNRAAGARPAVVPIHDYGLKYCAWNTLASESRMPEVLSRITPKQVEVEVIRLDDFVGEHRLAPAFVKIDAENFEREVIAGLAGTLTRYRPMVLLEAGSQGSLAAASMLEAQDYQLLVSDRPGSLHVWSGDAAAANARFKDLLFRVDSNAG